LDEIAQLAVLNGSRQTIIRIPKEFQYPMKVAIQGEPGSFSHEAASKIVPDAEIVHCAQSAEAFAALSEGRVDAAVIPIENSLAGSVTEHFDLLLKHDLKIVSEMHLRIRHNLISVSGANISEIDRVFSHPIALAQCRKFIAAHPRMQAFPFYDTAGSVKEIIGQRDRHGAAIASRAAAEFYGAQILAADIEDNPENFTRFYLIQSMPTRSASPSPSKTVREVWSVRLTQLPRSALTSLRLNRALCRENPGSTFFTSMRSSKIRSRMSRLSKHCARIAPW
jgi:prephenate dehydratase